MSRTRKTRSRSSSKDAELESEIPPHGRIWEHIWEKWEKENEPILESIEPLDEPLDPETRVEKIRQAYAQVCLHMSRATLWVTRLVELSVYPALSKKGKRFEPVILSASQVALLLKYVQKISAGDGIAGGYVRTGKGAGSASGTGRKGGPSK